MTGFLDRALRNDPDALALAGGRGRWSFRTLAEEADRLGARLGPAAGPGSVVALVLPATSAAVVALHGVARSGAVVAPLNHKLTAHELAAALRGLRPAAVVTSPGLASTVRAAGDAAGVPLEPPDRVTPAGPTSSSGPAPDLTVLVGAPGGRDPLTIDHPDAAAVVWTSGTAGPARGVLLATGALTHIAEASRERLGLQPDDRWFAALSPAHVGGLALIVRAALLGSAVVTRPALDVAELSGLMDGGEVTHTSLVPVLLRRLLEEREGRRAPVGLRCLLVGGAPAARPLVERAVELAYPVALTYGLTEATSQVATAPPDLARVKPWTVGPPLPGVEVRLAGDGEILVRGPTLALGTVGGDGTVLPADEGGWLRTGDLGERDGDGHLRITGRRSDRIITGGVTVDPGEVEAVLLAHSAVKEVAVVGVPDPEWGERVVAAVVTVPGGDSRLDDVEALCRERLSAAKVPRRLRAVDRLPRNANRKIDRAAVRVLLE